MKTQKYHVLRTFWHENAQYHEGEIREFTDDQAKVIGERRLMLSDGVNTPKKRGADGAPTDVKIRRDKSKPKVKHPAKQEEEELEDEEDELEDDEELEDEDAEDEELEDEEVEGKDSTEHPNKMVDKNTAKARRK